MRKMILMLLFVPFMTGCFGLGSQYYRQQEESSKAIQQGTAKRVATEYSPPLTVNINVSGEGKIDGEVVKEVISGVKEVATNKNKLDTNIADKVSDKSEFSGMEEMSVKESILITAIGCLLLFIVVVMATRWIKSTAIGQAVSAGMNSFSKLVQRELRELDDMLAIETDPDKIKELLKRKARLAQDELNYRTKK